VTNEPPPIYLLATFLLIVIVLLSNGVSRHTSPTKGSFRRAGGAAPERLSAIPGQSSGRRDVGGGVSLAAAVNSARMNGCRNRTMIAQQFGQQVSATHHGYRHYQHDSGRVNEELIANHVRIHGVDASASADIRSAATRRKHAVIAAIQAASPTGATSEIQQGASPVIVEEYLTAVVLEPPCYYYHHYRPPQSALGVGF
jgi:hypothetical protein